MSVNRLQRLTLNQGLGRRGYIYNRTFAKKCCKMFFLFYFMRNRV